MNIDKLPLGQRCQFYREYILKMTRQEFSYHTGLTLNQINHFENGRSHNSEILGGYKSLGFEE